MKIVDEYNSWTTQPKDMTKVRAAPHGQQATTAEGEEEKTKNRRMSKREGHKGTKGKEKERRV